MLVTQILDWYDERIAEFEQKNLDEGGIPRHDCWRYQYYKNPYLLLVSDEELRQRFIDLHSNVVYLTEDGKLAPQSLVKDPNNPYIVGWTQALEAYQSRHGGVQADFIEESNAEVHKYFDAGTPLGVQLFGNLPRVRRNAIVKFSRVEFLRDTLQYGRIRLAPASFYSQGSLLKSMKDLELARTFRVPAIKEALDGKTFYDYPGMGLLPIEGGAITVSMVGNDYYLYSACTELDRRMPLDFEANAALVVNDKRQFLHRFKKAVKKRFGQTHVKGGPVTYYDPFKPPTGAILQTPEFLKHFAYGYQREYRIVARPVSQHISKEPQFLELGDLSDIAELLTI